MRFFTPKVANEVFNDESTPELWTVIIPAAGRGSRLGYSKPKILYPIAGRTILDRLIDLLQSYCREFNFVLSPNGTEDVSLLVSKRLKNRSRVVFQQEPLGMADAIYRAVPYLATPHTLIIWGDQVAIRSETIRTLLKIHQYSPEAKLSLPIVRRKNPYVHYETDSSGRFVRVLERREGAIMPELGNSDCGLFALNTKDLQRIFQQEIGRNIKYGQGTKEWNFLPMLSQLERGGSSVNALKLLSLEETVGVNDINDVALLEKYFHKAVE